MHLTSHQFETQQREKKSSKFAGLERAAQRENDEFIGEQKEQVQMEEEKQDLVLEDMSVILKSIGVMAEEMKSELSDQEKYVARASVHARTFKLFRVYVNALYLQPIRIFATSEPVDRQNVGRKQCQGRRCQ